MALTSILFLDFCNLMYDCGCRSWWAGADAHCNIHDAEALRHCPWCSIGLAGSMAVWIAIAGVQVLAALRPGFSWVTRVVLSLGAFPLVGGMLAIGIGAAHGYWR